ncbi:MAG: AI-2E family transporter [Pseudomonadota bacterium]
MAAEKPSSVAPETDEPEQAPKPLGTGPPRAVPGWAGVGIFLMLLVGGFAYARVFLLPVVLAFLLTLVFTPVRRFLERWRVPPVASALLIVGTLLGALVTGVYLLSGPVQTWIEDAPRIGREVEEKLRGLEGPAQEVLEASERVDELTTGGETEDDEDTEVVVRDDSIVGSVAALAPTILGEALFTLVLLLLLLSSGDMVYEKIVHVMPTFQDKRRAIRIAYAIESQLSQYLFAITLINAGLGTAIGVGMWLIGMPNPLLLGVMGFALNYIPYLGAAVGVTIVTVVGLVTYDDVWTALLPGAVYFGLNSLEANIVTPYLVGRRLEMNTVVVFIAIAFWAWLWSIVGMLVAVPLLVTIRAFCEHIPRLQPLAEFLAARRTTTTTDEA